MALEDADPDSTVRLLEIYDGAKLMRRLNCTLKCRIFQHIIEGKPDSCIEIVAFLLFHETSDKHRKVVQLERLFLSTQKIFSEVKKALKTRVKITIGNLPFIVDYVYQRVCISSEMQLQLTHSVTQDDGTKLECILDLSFDGLKILAQLPHIDNIKDENRRKWSNKKSEWDIKIESFHAEINACESALMVANSHMETVSQAIQFFLHHFEKNKITSGEIGDNISAIAKTRWIKAICRVLLQNRVKKFTKRLEEIGYLLPIAAESIESPQQQGPDLEKRDNGDYKLVKLPSFLKVKFGSKNRNIGNSFIVNEDDQSPQIMRLRPSRSLSDFDISDEPNEVIEELDNRFKSSFNKITTEGAPSSSSFARPPLRKSTSKKKSTGGGSTLSKVMHGIENSLEEISEGVETFRKDMMEEFNKDGYDKHDLAPPILVPPLISFTKSPLHKSKSMKIDLTSIARPPLLKAQSMVKIVSREGTCSKGVNSIEHSINKAAEALLQDLNDDNPQDPGPISPRVRSRGKSNVSGELKPLKSPSSMDELNFDQLSPISPGLRPRGNSNVELTPLSPRLASNPVMRCRTSRLTTPIMISKGSNSPSPTPLCSPRSMTSLGSSQSCPTESSPIMSITSQENSNTKLELIPIYNPGNISSICSPNSISHLTTLHLAKSCSFPPSR